MKKDKKKRYKFNWWQIDENVSDYDIFNAFLVVLIIIVALRIAYIKLT